MLYFLHFLAVECMRLAEWPPSSADSSASQTALSVPIESIRVGDRVWGDNPDAPSQFKSEVDLSTWRLLKLRALALSENGEVTDINVETLQPPEWLKHNQAAVGTLVPIPLDLLEMGFPEDLQAEVLAIERCPPLKAGPGRLVLTTVISQSNALRELEVEDAQGRRVQLRPTALHKFYAEPSGTWLGAKDLAIGQTLRGRDGPVVVTANKAVRGLHRVYNLTVEGHHVYEVSALGVLTHNNECFRIQVRGNVTAPAGHIQVNGPPKTKRGRIDFVCLDGTKRLGCHHGTHCTPRGRPRIRPANK